MKAGCLLIFLALVGIPALLLVGIVVGANWDSFVTILLLVMYGLVGAIGLIAYKAWWESPEESFVAWYSAQDRDTSLPATPPR